MIEFTLGEWRIGLAPSSKPKAVVLETTTRCNMSCRHCFRFSVAGKLRFGDMDWEIFEKILDDALRCGVRRITFSGWGEPTVHPDILWMVREAKATGLEVALNTNGLTLDLLAEELWSIGLDELIVSVDAPEPGLYGELRGEGFERVTAGLLRLRELRLKSPTGSPRVKLLYTLNTLNYGLLTDMMSYASKVGAYELVLSNYIPIGRGEEHLTLIGKPGYEKLIPELGKESLRFNVKVVKPNLTFKTGRRCPFVESSALFIRWDGMVSPCVNYAHSWTPVIDGIRRTLNPVVFGDVNIESLGEIWRKPNYAKFRFKVKTGCFPSCLDCELRNYCSYTLTNDSDCWGNTPTCSHCPYAREVCYCPL